MRVSVHRNLNNATKFWSVTNREPGHIHKGLVIAWTERVLIADCTFVVSEASRQRCIREQRKNVNAWVYGTLVEMSNFWDRMTKQEIGHFRLEPFFSKLPRAAPFSFNPYKNRTFIRVDTGAPILTAPYAFFNGKTAVIGVEKT